MQRGAPWKHGSHVEAGIWYLVLATWYFLLGTWYLVFVVTCYLVLGTRCLVLGTCCLVLVLVTWLSCGGRYSYTPNWY